MVYTKIVYLYLKLEKWLIVMNSYFDLVSLKDLLDEIKYVYQSDDRPWIIGYSGGKDSTTVVELVYEMLKSLKPQERHKNVYIVSSDTLIENPLIKVYLSKMNTMLGESAEKDGLPIKSCMVTPEFNNTFWTNIIGKGLPTPRMNGTFRWCTDRLKIKPSADKIKSIMAEEKKEVIVLLGVRKAESIDAYVYNPIVELTTDDVWKVLLEHNNGKTPWGSDNSELVALYSDADSGECPFAGMSNSGQTQSCGQSRFGCWCCTVVKDDKSLNGFIKAGHRELIPLAEFRSWLMSIRDVDEYREKKHRDGTVYADKHGNKGYGPFTWEARKLILTKLIKTQRAINYELITLDELRAIDEIWDRELDLSRRVLVDLYYNLTGEKLPWDSYKEALIKEDTVTDIEEMCKEFDVPSELVRNLILSVHQNKNYSNPKIMRKDLERLLNQQWLHFDILKEIDNADNETGA